MRVRMQRFKNLSVWFFVLSVALSMFSISLEATDWNRVLPVYTLVDGNTVITKKWGDYRAAVYGDGIFVCVGDSGLIITAPAATAGSGDSWSKVNTGLTAGRNFYGVTYGLGKFVAVGKNGLIWTSTNGTSWHEVRPYSTTETSFSAVACNGENLFVAVGVGRISTSPDGETWTKVDTTITQEMRGLCYGNGKFVAAASSGRIFYSSNGTTWSSADTNTGINNYSAVFGEGIYIVGGQVPDGEQGAVFTSSDAKTWTKRYYNQPNYVMDFDHTDTKFFGIGDGNDAGCSLIIVSDAGTSWVRDRLNPNQNEKRTLLGAAAGSSNAIAAGAAGVLFYNTYSGLGEGKNCAGGATTYITVLTPNGGEFVKRGTSYKITWKSAGVTDPVRIRLSFNNGADGYDYVVASSITNTGEYTWAVPKDIKSSTSCLIKILALNQSGTPYDVSNSVFEIADVSTQNYITVNSPNGGESYKAKSIIPIRWTSSTKFKSVDIEYTLDGGSKWTSMVTGTADDGYYEWTAPDVATTKARIWLRGWANSGTNPSDYSDGLFSITGGVGMATIEFTAPKTGTKIYNGSTYTIKWSSSKKFDSVDIEYNKNATDSSGWTKVVTGTTDDGAYDWTVPNVTASNAAFWIKGNSTSGNDTDKVEGVIIASGTSIKITYPAAGQKVAAGSTYNIVWDESRKFDKVDIEYYNGAAWSPLVTGIEDRGVYEWTVPDTKNSQARLWIKGWSASGNAADTTDYFSIAKLNGSITVTSPNGDEAFPHGAKHTITWTSAGTVGNVAISYTADGCRTWNTIIETTANDGSYEWTVPSGVSSDSCKVKIYDISDTALADTSNKPFAIGWQPEIGVDKTTLYFGYVMGESTPCSQNVFVFNEASGKLKWTAASETAWIKLSPSSATGDGNLTVSIDITGLTVGTHTGFINIVDNNAVNTPLSIPVTLKIKESGQNEAPFGAFGTPNDGATGLAGSVPITGWALDDVCLESVKIYRVMNDAGDLSLIGDGVFVEGARPDIEQAFPDYPNNSRAGWGYMLLSNMLSDGQLKLKVIATDVSGKTAELGTRTMSIDNAHSKTPFGAIDYPAQGGDAAGSTYRNSGWVLTPQPNKIATNGSTINVFIDGVYVGKAKYNIPRTDVASIFPGLANSGGPMAYYDFDTTGFKNGIHTIWWGVSDSGGNNAGIGSRFFKILNPDSTARTTLQSMYKIDLARLNDSLGSGGTIDISKGFGSNAQFERVYGDDYGIFHVNMAELERLRIELDETFGISQSDFTNEETLSKRKPVQTGVFYSGYMLVNNELRPLPAGSSIDPVTGTFSWNAGPGFVGDYELVFFIDYNGSILKKQVKVNISSTISVQDNIDEIR